MEYGSRILSIGFGLGRQFDLQRDKHGMKYNIKLMMTEMEWGTTYYKRNDMRKTRLCRIHETRNQIDWI